MGSAINAAILIVVAVVVGGGGGGGGGDGGVFVCVFFMFCFFLSLFACCIMDETNNKNSSQQNTPSTVSKTASVKIRISDLKSLTVFNFKYAGTGHCRQCPTAVSAVVYSRSSQ